MNRKLHIFILACAMFVAACSPQAAPIVTVAPAPTTAPTQAVNAQDFDSARALADNRVLAVDIGKRVAGTESGTRAADYIANEFQKSGLQVTRQAFPFEGWEDRGTTVKSDAQGVAIEAQAIQYSPGGNVEGDVVAIPGSGARNDFAQVNVRDKIALVKRGTLTFSDKAANAQEQGAKAILIYNDQPPIFTGTLRDRVKIPVIAISGASADGLLKAMQNAAIHITIASDTGIVQHTGYNVIGILRGKSDETIVLGGHYDSVDAGPGAVDNASGTATLVELARVFGSKPQPQHTLVFIAFDAEELGLLGSRAYVDNLSNEQVGKIRAMLNFDMLGGGSGPLLLLGDGSVALLARSSANQLGIPAQNGSLPANAGSDHQSFARRGVDTVFFMRDYTLLHTPQDTMEQVKQEYLADAGRVAQRVLERLDTAPAQ